MNDFSCCITGLLLPPAVLLRVLDCFSQERGLLEKFPDAVCVQTGTTQFWRKGKGKELTRMKWRGKKDIVGKGKERHEMMRK